MTACFLLSGTLTCQVIRPKSGIFLSAEEMRQLFLRQPSRCSYREVNTQSCCIQCQQQFDTGCHVVLQLPWESFQADIHDLFHDKLSKYPAQSYWRTNSPTHFGGATGHSPQLRRWGQALSKARLVKSPEHVCHHCEYTAGCVFEVIGISCPCLYVRTRRSANMAAGLSLSCTYQCRSLSCRMVQASLLYYADCLAGKINNHWPKSLIVINPDSSIT